MAKDMHVEKTIGIAKSKEQVFEYLKFIRNQDQFSVWNMADPNKKVETKGTDGSVGFTYSWDSKNKNVGAGTQEIKKIVNGERIDCQLRFERPMKNIADASFVIKQRGPSSTEVTWSFTGPTKFPMSLFSFVFKRMLGKDMAQSLENLKKRLEN